MVQVLEQHEIVAQDPLGQPFDPSLQEALMRQPSADVAPGEVLKVFEKGYTIGDRLVRPARVVVATKPE